MRKEQAIHARVLQKGVQGMLKDLDLHLETQDPLQCVLCSVHHVTLNRTRPLLSVYLWWLIFDPSRVDHEM